MAAPISADKIIRLIVNAISMFSLFLGGYLVIGCSLAASAIEAAETQSSHSPVLIVTPISIKAFAALMTDSFVCSVMRFLSLV